MQIIHFYGPEKIANSWNSNRFRIYSIRWKVSCRSFGHCGEIQLRSRFRVHGLNVWLGWGHSLLMFLQTNKKKRCDQRGISYLSAFNVGDIMSDKFKENDIAVVVWVSVRHGNHNEINMKYLDLHFSFIFLLPCTHYLWAFVIYSSCSIAHSLLHTQLSAVL